MIFVYRKGKMSLRVGNRQLLGTLMDSAELICDNRALLFQCSGWNVGIRIGRFNRVFSLRKVQVKTCYEPLESPKRVWYQDRQYEFQPYQVWVYDNSRLRSKEIQYRVISVDGVPSHPLFNLVGGKTPIEGIRSYLMFTQRIQVLPEGEKIWQSVTATYLF